MNDSPITDLNDDDKPVWTTENGHTYWLKTPDGRTFIPPRWVYWLCAQAEKKGRNSIRHEIAALLKNEK